MYYKYRANLLFIIIHPHYIIIELQYHKSKALYPNLFRHLQVINPFPQIAYLISVSYTIETPNNLSLTFYPHYIIILTLK